MFYFDSKEIINPKYIPFETNFAQITQKSIVPYLHASRKTEPASGEVMTTQSNALSACIKDDGKKWINEKLWSTHTQDIDNMTDLVTCFRKDI